VWALCATLAACGRIHFDTAAGAHAQTLSIAASSDDGDIDNMAVNPDGEAGKVDYAGYWTSTSQSSWAYYRFQLAEPIPAGAILTANTRLRLWGANGSRTGANTFEFNSVTAELAASTTAPTAAADVPLALTIYADALGSGWHFQGGGGTSTTVQSAVVASGTNALFVDINMLNGGWLELTSGYHALQTGDFESVSFDINVGNTASPDLDALRIETLGTATSVTISGYGAGGHFLPDTWYHVVIPTADFLVGGGYHFDFADTTSAEVSFYLDNLQLAAPAGSYRVLTSATVIWPSSDATAYVAGDWNTSPSLAPVLQELVDTYGALDQGSYVTIWVEGPSNGFGYSNAATYLAGYADYALDPALAAQLKIEYSL
jgi:hypothetical protein